MARFRLAHPARADLVNILTVSAERWGREGRRRYARLLLAAMRQIAAEPQGPLSRKRSEVAAGLRSFHVRHAHHRDVPKVRQPVHILYYRIAKPGVVEIVRVLHERMDPSRHVDELPHDADS